MRDISGPRIGEILAEVDTHCADSGEEPREAFGDPIAYARSFEFPAPAPRGQLVARALVGGFAAAAGALALLAGVNGIAHHTNGTVKVGDLVAVGAATVALGVFATVRRSGRLLTALPAVAMVAIFAPIMLLRTPAFHLPGWTLLLGGLSLLTVALWRNVTGRIPKDPVLDPRTGADAVPAPRWLLPLVTWILPVALIIAAVLTAGLL